MNAVDWVHLAAFLLVLAALTKPLGLYIQRVLDPRGRTFLDPGIKPLERTICRLMKIDVDREQDWKEYLLSVLVFGAAGFLFTFAILRLQHLLPLNPEALGPVAPDLAFNTAVSFMTNTNWQNYSGENTLSYFSQMVGLTFHHFVSAATGIAVAAAFVRGISRDRAATIGCFQVDLIRSCLYLLLPICLVYALFLVFQGTIQNFSPYLRAGTLDGGAWQIIAQGPMASQTAIKMLGTNGGGFMGANASHPYENPTPLSNFVQVLSILLIPSSLTYYLGRAVRNSRHGWSVWAAMLCLFLSGLLICWWAEARGNPRLEQLGVDASFGNMEGKEVRFGIFSSALFGAATTAASCGAVNSMHDSFTPLGGWILLFNMMLGEVVFGGVGVGLCGMLIFILLAIFLAGLMIGRTPEYLGKKIENRDVQVCALAVLIPSILPLVLTAITISSEWGTASLNNSGPHGLSEILYAYTSAANNNGSAFAGLSANTPWYNLTLGFSMLAGRFIVIMASLALAGNFARKRALSGRGGGFPVSGGTFCLLLVATVVLVGALTFLPVLSMGPILEHFLMTGSDLLF